MRIKLGFKLAIFFFFGKLLIHVEPLQFWESQKCLALCGWTKLLIYNLFPTDIQTHIHEKIYFIFNKLNNHFGLYSRHVLNTSWHNIFYVKPRIKFEVLYKTTLQYNRFYCFISGVLKLNQITNSMLLFYVCSLINLNLMTK